MPTLAVADEADLHAIYRESRSLWAAGLSLGDYIGLWEDLRDSTWGRLHVRYYVLRGARGEVLSSLKLYRPRVRVNGRESRAFVIGAVFTPRAARRRGHAAALLGKILQRGRDADAGVALLFSDIRTGFYEQFGFNTLPCSEQWADLPPSAVGADDSIVFRPATEADLESIASAHADGSQRRALALLRDADHWEFLRIRTASFFRRLRDASLRQDWLVAMTGGRFRGYVISVEGRGEWSLREVGCPGGAPADLASLVRTAAYRARLRGLRRFHGWLPPEVVGEFEDWRLRAEARKRAIPMVLPLRDARDLEPLREPVASFLPYQDQF